MTILPVYISLTSIFKNQNVLLNTLKSIKNQTLIPDKIYIWLSEEGYLLDSGFKNKLITNKQLIDFLLENTNIIEVKFTENVGPYRKLLPLLKEKWDEDCIIITLDDDLIYHNDLIKNLVNDYNNHKCVINYRGFSPTIENNDLTTFKYLKRNKLIIKDKYNFPTNGAGSVYHPSFFHKTGDLIFRKDIFTSTCKTADDLWYYLIRILNNIECYLGSNQYGKFQPTTGLYLTYNGLNDANTKQFLATVEKLKELNYFI